MDYMTVRDVPSLTSTAANDCSDRIPRADTCAYRYPCNIDDSDPGPLCGKRRDEHPLKYPAWETDVRVYQHSDFVEASDVCVRCMAQQLHPIHDPQYGGSHGFERAS